MSQHRPNSRCPPCPRHDQRRPHTPQPLRRLRSRPAPTAAILFTEPGASRAPLRDVTFVIGSADPGPARLLRSLAADQGQPASVAHTGGAAPVAESADPRPAPPGPGVDAYGGGHNSTAPTRHPRAHLRAVEHIPPVPAPAGRATEHPSPPHQPPGQPPSPPAKPHSRRTIAIRAQQPVRRHPGLDLSRIRPYCERSARLLALHGPPGRFRQDPPGGPHTLPSRQRAAANERTPATRHTSSDVHTQAKHAALVGT